MRLLIPGGIEAVERTLSWALGMTLNIRLASGSLTRAADVRCDLSVHGTSLKIMSSKSLCSLSSTPGRIRTDNTRGLKPLPLPVELRAHGTTDGIRTHTVSVLSGAPPSGWATVARVRSTGLEPARALAHGHLKPARLPIPPRSPISVRAARAGVLVLAYASSNRDKGDSN